MASCGLEALDSVEETRAAVLAPFLFLSLVLSVGRPPSGEVLPNTHVWRG